MVGLTLAQDCVLLRGWGVVFTPLAFILPCATCRHNCGLFAQMNRLNFSVVFLLKPVTRLVMKTFFGNKHEPKSTDWFLQCAVVLCVVIDTSTHTLPCMSIHPQLTFPCFVALTPRIQMDFSISNLIDTKCTVLWRYKMHFIVAQTKSRTTKQPSLGCINIHSQVKTVESVFWGMSLPELYS